MLRLTLPRRRRSEGLSPAAVRLGLVAAMTVGFAGRLSAADPPSAKPPAKGSSMMTPDSEMMDKAPGRPATMPAGTQPSTQAATAPSEPEPIPLGERLRVTLTVKSAAIDRVPLHRVTPYPPGRKGPKETASQDFLLVIRLEVKNDCQMATLVIENPGGATPETAPSLEDSTGQGFGSVNFGDFAPADALSKVSLRPGETAPDMLVFAPPPGDVTPLHLRIPRRISGRNLVLEADLDPKQIKRK